eukprot:91255-Rhodomonas_salina.1
MLYPCPSSHSIGTQASCDKKLMTETRKYDFRRSHGCSTVCLDAVEPRLLVGEAGKGYLSLGECGDGKGKLVLFTNYPVVKLMYPGTTAARYPGTRYPRVPVPGVLSKKS